MSALTARTFSLFGAIATAIAVALAIAAPAGAAGSASAPTYPTGAVNLPGVNNWSCVPSAAHPEPVVVVHGTFGDKQHLLERLEETLVANGYCTFALDYGNRATGPIQESAKELRTFVNKVLAATGAAKVSMVGHSQGGMMPRYYIKFLGGASKVDDLVGLAPSNHGTLDASGLNPSAGSPCESCVQQAYNSPFLEHLNAGDETPGPVSYTNIESKYDEVVVPYTSAFLSGPASQVTNITLQNLCPLDLSEHLTIPSDNAAIQIALNALGRPGPADPNFHPSCLP